MTSREFMVIEKSKQRFGERKEPSYNPRFRNSWQEQRKAGSTEIGKLRNTEARQGNTKANSE